MSKVLLGLLLVSLSHPVWALSDAERAEEAEVYAREEQEDEKNKMKPNVKTSWEGVVHLQDAEISATPGPTGAGGPSVPEGVVGSFVINGKEMMLKTETPRLMEDLKKVNGKTVTLTGKIRVNGKYFIAQSVLVPQPGPPRKNRVKRGGG